MTLSRRRIIERVTEEIDTVTLWRPPGPEELALVEASGWREWPPRLPGQPIFYPVLNEQYAMMIARDWNVRRPGAGYVTRFRVRRPFLDRYEIHQVGGQTILEYWIPAEDLGALNANIVRALDPRALLTALVTTAVAADHGHAARRRRTARMLWPGSI